MADYIINGPKLESKIKCSTLLLAHGAGAAMDSEFMNAIAELISASNIRVVRFEFPYMAARRTTGKKAPPPKAEKLMPAYEARVREIAKKSNGPLIVGGKSMGGRIATMIADDCLQQGLISGAICLGYPFHPPGKPDTLRTTHLEHMRTLTLICQGERDAFGSRAEIEAIRLSKALTFDWATDGNHDLKPRKTSGLSHVENLQKVANVCVSFVNSVG